MAYRVKISYRHGILRSLTRFIISEKNTVHVNKFIIPDIFSLSKGLPIA